MERRICLADELHSSTFMCLLVLNFDYFSITVVDTKSSFHDVNNYRLIVFYKDVINSDIPYCILCS